MSNTNDSGEVDRGFLPLSNSIYTKMKFITLVLLPALSTLYFTLGAVWKLPATEQVIGTIAAISTFLGVLLGLSTRAYNKSDAKYDGLIVITTKDDGKKLYSLELNGQPNTLDDKHEVTFKVGPPS